MNPLRAIAAMIAAVLLTLALVAMYKHVHANLAPLTEKEQLHLRTLQVNLTNSQAELQKTKEYAAFQSDQKALQDAAHEVFTSRKISETDYTICDGGLAKPVCDGVPTGQLELRPIPKQQTAKK